MMIIKIGMAKALATRDIARKTARGILSVQSHVPREEESF